MPDERLIELKLPCSQTRFYEERKERADLAAKHVFARMTLVTEQNITRETIGRVFESREFLPLVGFTTGILCGAERIRVRRKGRS